MLICRRKKREQSNWKGGKPVIANYEIKDKNSSYFRAKEHK